MNKNKDFKYRELILEEIEEGLKNGEIDKLRELIIQNLWLLNEDYIYYKRVSGDELKDIEYEGKRVFGKEFSKDEEGYLKFFREKKLTSRPEIFLFPEMGRCVILEFKDSLKIDISEYLTHMDFCASLLRNKTSDDLQLTTFYSYLIGENLKDRAIRGRLCRFEYVPKFDLWVRSSERLLDLKTGKMGIFGRK